MGISYGSHSSSDADSCKNNGLWPRWKVPVVTSRLPQVKKKLFFFLITAIVWVLLSVIFHFPYFYSKASCLLCSLSIPWHSVAFYLAYSILFHRYFIRTLRSQINESIIFGFFFPLCIWTCHILFPTLLSLLFHPTHLFGPISYDIYIEYPPYSFIWPYSFNWHLRVFDLIHLIYFLSCFFCFVLNFLMSLIYAQLLE